MLTEPNLARSKKFLKQKINIPNAAKEKYISDNFI